MLKFGASQHFQEVSHEPPGTERGRSLWVMRGWVLGAGVGEGGCARGRVCVCVCAVCEKWRGGVGG